MVPHPLKLLPHGWPIPEGGEGIFSEWTPTSVFPPHLHPVSIVTPGWCTPNILIGAPFVVSALSTLWSLCYISECPPEACRILSIAGMTPRSLSTGGGLGSGTVDHDPFRQVGLLSIWSFQHQRLLLRSWPSVGCLGAGVLRYPRLWPYYELPYIWKKLFNLFLSFG